MRAPRNQQTLMHFCARKALRYAPNAREGAFEGGLTLQAHRGVVDAYVLLMIRTQSALCCLRM